MDADEIIGAPGIGHIDTCLQAAGRTGPQHLLRVHAGSTHRKAAVLIEQVSEHVPHFEINCLLLQPVGGSAGVDRAWIMPLIDEYADRHFCPSSLYHPMKKGQAVMGFV